MPAPAAPVTRSILALRTQGGRPCALPLESVEEVMRPLPVDPLKGAPDGVLGLSVIRGDPVPVVSLDALIEAPSVQNEARKELSPARALSPRAARFVTIRAGRRRVALAVAEVVGMRHLTGTEFEALPPLWQGPRSPAVSNLAVQDNELWLVLETGRVLPDVSW